MEADINKIDRRERNQVTIVAAAGCLGNYLAITGIENVYLAIASLLNNTFPIFVILVAFFLLKERLTRNQAIGISFAFIGMVLMSLSSLNSVQDQGLSTNKQALGFLLIVLSELFGALSFTISKLTPRTPPLTLANLKVSLIFAVASISIGFQMLTAPSYLVSLASLLLDPLTLIYFFLIATLDLSVNFLIFYTFRSESASMVASVNFLCVVWSIIIDVTVLGYRVKSWLEVFGGLIVLISTSAIVFVKKL